jgi:predicted DNA-binding transcriptional regulator AlpA
MHSTDNQPDTLTLLPAKQVAQLLGLGLSTFWRYLSLGRVPAPLTIGNKKRWRADELSIWIQAGCPKREDWRRHPTNKWSNRPGLFAKLASKRS